MRVRFVSARAVFGNPRAYVLLQRAHVSNTRSEFSNTFGFPTCQTAACPCLYCVCTTATMYALVDFRPGQFPFALVNHDNYHAACLSAEIRVVMTDALKAIIAPLLVYDKRTTANSANGRRLVRDVPGTPLRANDRLEPSEALSDVAHFEVVEAGTTMIFWRRSAETRTRHRNPLMDPLIGVTLRIMVVDTLHAFNLGPLKEYCKHLTWELIAADAWRVGGNRTREEVIAMTCMRVHHDLTLWYKARRASHPHEKMTEIQAFTPKMLGSIGKRALGLKAAETKYYFLFLRSVLLGTQGARLPRSDLWIVGYDALSQILDTFSREKMLLPASVVQDRWVGENQFVCWCVCVFVCVFVCASVCACTCV